MNNIDIEYKTPNMCLLLNIVSAKLLIWNFFIKQIKKKKMLCVSLKIKFAVTKSYEDRKYIFIGVAIMIKEILSDIRLFFFMYQCTKIKVLK